MDEYRTGTSLHVKKSTRRTVQAFFIHIMFSGGFIVHILARVVDHNMICARSPFTSMVFVTFTVHTACGAFIIHIMLYYTFTLHVPVYGAFTVHVMFSCAFTPHVLLCGSFTVNFMIWCALWGRLMFGHMHFFFATCCEFIVCFLLLL